MNSKYLIIADDFTGSNDTGVQLCRRGYPTKVFFGKPEFWEDGGESIVIDTESRSADPDFAHDIVKQAVEGIDFSSYRYVIKKIDSTLRGNIAEEVKALEEAYLPELVVFLTAYPDLGRTTQDGIQCLNGLRICQTELAKDPKNPVIEDDLEKLLRQVCQEPVRKIKINEVRSGSNPLDSGRIFVFDSLLNEDMRLVLEQVRRLDKKVLWVGTAGLVDHMMELEEPSAPAFGVVTSISTVTNQQIRYCEKDGYQLVKIPVHEVLLGKTDPTIFVSEAIEYLKQGKDTILLTTTSLDREDLKQSEQAGKEKGMTLSETGDYVRSLIGKLAREILMQTKVAGIFLTGGDTALGVLMNMEARGAEILTEIQTGIPMVRVTGGMLDGMKAITKAGAFGKEDSIAFAMKKLKEKKGETE